MADAKVVEWIRRKSSAIAEDLDERARRRWAAAEAMSLGWGGVTAVALATGMSDRTIRNGRASLPSGPPNDRPTLANHGTPVDIRSAVPSAEHHASDS